MSLGFRPAPSLEDLRRSRVHEVIRDYPEALELLSGRGSSLAALGGSSLEEAGILGPGELEAIRIALAWRGPA